MPEADIGQDVLFACAPVCRTLFFGLLLLFDLFALGRPPLGGAGTVLRLSGGCRRSPVRRSVTGSASSRAPMPGRR